MWEYCGNIMSSEFYDANSPLANTAKEDKSNIDLENEIALCDYCENIILKPYQDNKLICTKCGQVYDPHYELVKVQTQETTLDEISSQGKLSYKDESKKPISKTHNYKEARLENQEYVAKEFSRYKQIEIIDKDTITGLNKTRRPRLNNE